ncbi:MAG: hypothetical protein ABMA26_26620 [Limisphaerales bacterium]
MSALALLLFVPLLTAQPAPPSPDLSIPGLPTLSLWDAVLTLQSSAGYKDNVALSATRPSGSAFVRNQAEAIVFRLPMDGLEFNAFLSGEDTRFLASDVVDKEQNALAYAQLKKTWSEAWSTSLAGQYIYQNQVVDLSTSLATPTVLAVESHTYAARFAVRRKFAERWWWELEPSLTRQDFNSPLDDYWEGGPKFFVGREFGRKSEVSVSYELSHRPYDHREQFNRAAAAIPGSELAFTQHRAQFVWKHHWDEARRWRTTAKLGYESSYDNGPGYYDFRKWQVSQQIRWAAAPWEVSLSGRFADYNYPRQPVAIGDSRAIVRTDFNLNLHVERALTKRVKWFLDCDWERSQANQPATGYAVNLVHSGLSVEF